MARRDPDSLVGGDAPVTVDEVQRAPDLMLAVKRAIDRDRRPGRFLLTASANLLRFRREFLSGLRTFERGAEGKVTSYLVYRGDEELEVDGVRVLPVERFIRKLHAGEIIP